MMKGHNSDIIEKQRKIAERIGKAQGHSTEKAAPPAPILQIRRNTLKRPSTSSVLAAARSKAGGKVAGKKKTALPVKFRRKSTVTNTPVVQESNGTTTSSRLASLVQSVSKEQDDGTSLATPYSPDDFWKNIREWSFVNDIYRQMQGVEDEDKHSALTKPIPDTFINTRHYIMSWGPKCLAEARAQLLAELLTENGECDSNRNPFILVDVETTWKSGRKARGLHMNLTDTDACHLQLKTRERTSVQFFCHDICGLIPVEKKDMVQIMLRGRQLDKSFVNGFGDSFSQFGMIGHTETQRKELNGLILKAVVGSKKMYFFRIGSNITALREFTALCKVNSIPLKKFLLGNHLESTKEGSRSPASEKARVNEDLVERMGGVSALGKGFTEYVQRKFNSSQLRAISAASRGYGNGGITLIKGPPGTGKTTMLVAVLNSLHIRQYNKYYDEVRRIAAMQSGNRQAALDIARKAKPRLLVCAPSNAGVDNIIFRIMEQSFTDGSGAKYKPSMIRVGVGQSSAVRDVALQTKVDQILSDTDVSQLDKSIAGFRMELQRISADIARCRRKVHAIATASPWPLEKDWEIRVDEDPANSKCRVYFVNHKEQRTTYDCPPPPEPGEKQFHATSMPEYRTFMARIVKLVENYFSIKSNLELSIIVKGSMENGANQFAVRQALEAHVLNSVHIVMTTLGSAGNRVLEAADKFEVVVVDEAAQSVEPSTLSALQLGSHHCVLVGDTNQLPATIFNISGRNSKYDRSLFQRLEEAGQQVFMLNEQYRMHPMISHFPRTIFYGGLLKDGPNVKHQYGDPLLKIIKSRAPQIQPFTVLDLDSKEERGGTSLSNSTEAHLVIHLFSTLRDITNGNMALMGRVAVVTPYSQQASLLKRFFRNLLGNDFSKFVDVNTVDAFQGREANIVFFSAVRAAGSHGIGFLSDVRRMNVALTRAKHLLFVIARCDSIIVNPYWNELVQHARGQKAVLKVPSLGTNQKAASSQQKPWFGNVEDWIQDKMAGISRASTEALGKPIDPRQIGNVRTTVSLRFNKKPTDPRETSNVKTRVSSSVSDSKKPTDPRKTTKSARSVSHDVSHSKTLTDSTKLANTSRGSDSIHKAKKPTDPRKRKRL